MNTPPVALKMCLFSKTEVNPRAPWVNIKRTPPPHASPWPTSKFGPSSKLQLFKKFFEKDIVLKKCYKTARNACAFRFEISHVCLRRAWKRGARECARLVLRRAPWPYHYLRKRRALPSARALVLKSLMQYLSLKLDAPALSNHIMILSIWNERLLKWKTQNVKFLITQWNKKTYKTENSVDTDALRKFNF